MFLCFLDVEGEFSQTHIYGISLNRVIAETLW